MMELSSMYTLNLADMLADFWLVGNHGKRLREVYPTH